MKAMLLERIAPITTHGRPLTSAHVPDPEPGPQEVVVEVLACGVCHTELDEIEGRTPPPVLPVIPGHQVVGRIVATGTEVTGLKTGQRVGVGWIHSACGACDACRRGDENLCLRFRATGRDAHGGYARFMAVPQASAIPVPEGIDDIAAAPLLCAGAIGYRSLRLAGIGDRQRLGLTGFGASAHLVLKMVRHRFPRSEVFVFARSEKVRSFALSLGAVWAGTIGEPPPHPLDAVIDTTPAWKPVVAALETLAPGGRLVINAIRKEETDRDWLLKLDYPRHLWMEKEIKSVANVARRDIVDCFEMAAAIGMEPEVTTFPLEEANRALVELKSGGGRGAKVLLPRS